MRERARDPVLQEAARRVERASLVHHLDLESMQKVVIDGKFIWGQGQGGVGDKDARSVEPDAFQRGPCLMISIIIIITNWLHANTV